MKNVIIKALESILDKLGKKGFIRSSLLEAYKQEDNKHEYSDIMSYKTFRVKTTKSNSSKYKIRKQFLKLKL